jgi:hypothetical protein
LAHENSIHPSRYQPYEEALNRKLEEAARAAVQGQAAPPAEHLVPRWTRALGAVALAAAGLAFVAGARSDTTSRLSTGPGTMFSAQLAGAGASAQDLIPPQPRPAPPTAAPTAATRDAQTPREFMRELEDRPQARVRRPPAPAPSPTPCVNCPETAPASVVLFDATGEHGVLVPAAVPEARPVVNVGTRIRATVPEPIMTSPGGTPVLALVAEQVTLGERVILPAGARLIGDAFSIEEDDRVQVVLTALVLDGKTVPLSGVVLSDDNRLGLPAKVVKKASKGKRGLGKALGVAASTLSFGLIPRGSDLGAAAASQLANETARELSQVHARWTRSDKVLRAPAGNVTVYLRSDLELP